MGKTMQKQELTERLSPMPRRIEVGGADLICPDDLRIAIPEESIWTDRAVAEFCDFFENLTGVSVCSGSGKVQMDNPVIYFLPPSANLHKGLFEHPFFDDFNFYPGYQSYRIAPLPGQKGIVLQGLDPEGVYWGMKTLKQALIMKDGLLCLPRLFIADGGDMEERGLWSQPFGTTCRYDDPDEALNHYKGWIDWMSDHKLNLFEIMTVGEGGGVCYRSKAHPEFNHKDAEEREFLLRELINYGDSHGLRMLPIFSHPEHFSFVSDKFPELTPENTVTHHGKKLKIAVDFFQGKTRRILQDIAEELMAGFSPRGLCFWLSENRLHSLKRSEQEGRSEFLREAETYWEIAQSLRENKPDLECKILLSQGSFPENLKLMRELPPEVKWIFYSGERFGTYNVRPKNPIHRDIASGAARGRWISLCNALRGVPGRPTHLATLHRNIGYALDAGLKGLDGMSYSFPGDIQALTVAAEHSWNYNGRRLEATLRRMAVEAGVEDAERQAKAYSLFDGANVAHARLNSMGIGQPFGNFSRFANMLERIRDDAPVDELIMLVADHMETQDLPMLAEAAENLERALHLADQQKDTLFVLRSKFLLRIIRVGQEVARAFYVHCREKSRDTYKGDWEDYSTEMRSLIDRLNVHAEKGKRIYAELVRAEGWSQAMCSACDPLSKTAELARQISGVKVEK